MRVGAGALRNYAGALMGARRAPREPRGVHWAPLGCYHTACSPGGVPGEALMGAREFLVLYVEAGTGGVEQGAIYK